MPESFLPPKPGQAGSDSRQSERIHRPDGPRAVIAQPCDKAALTAAFKGATVCRWYVNRCDGLGCVKLSGAKAPVCTAGARNPRQRRVSATARA